MQAEDKEKQKQRQRFEEAARKLGVDLDEAKLKEALRKIAPEKTEKGARK